jgi:hypothetical protein
VLLWLGRGLLTFLILRKFMPRHLPFCFLAGAIVLLHAADGAIQWVGQMNQFGFIFWMLLAFYLLIAGMESKRISLFILLTLAACFFEYMSLWSYEAQLLLILLAPVTLWLFRPAYRKRALAAAAAWYFVPGLYIFKTIVRYRQTAGASYQESVLRKSWSAAGLLGDLFYSIGASLRFWDWTRTTPVKLPLSQLQLYAAAGALIFVTGAAAMIFYLQKRQASDVFQSPAKPLWWALASGVVLLFLSFPVYMLLNSVRGLWRTQFLSSIGAGIVISALACLAARYLPARALRIGVFLACGASVAWCGMHAAIVRGCFTRWNWELHRFAIAEMLSVLPSVKTETVILYTGIPKNEDPFVHDMWFDVAVRLAYPGAAVGGLYFYEDGTAAPGDNFQFEASRFRWNGPEIETPVSDVAANHLVVLEFQKQGPARVLPQLPGYLHPTEAAMRAYDPQNVLNSLTPSPLAVRRYGPIPNCQPSCLSLETHAP